MGHISCMEGIFNLSSLDWGRAPFLILRMFLNIDQKKKAFSIYLNFY